ncbi:TIGR04086 family membrane protein [Pontibacillus salicampi]|uniref:TIGR04086 family membrane protein n=1 Tax=Pontibacillus salicampi TaxID=1449801 RepID=A0ABV6LJG1_9BACI
MTKDRLMALMYGWIAIFILMTVSSLILAIILRFSEMTESTLQWTTLVIGLLTLFAGGFISGMKGKEKGWLLGVLTGAGFTLIVLLFRYLGYEEGMGLTQMLYHSGYVAIALLGGMIGVNMSSSTQ